MILFVLINYNYQILFNNKKSIFFNFPQNPYDEIRIIKI